MHLHLIMKIKMKNENEDEIENQNDVFPAKKRMETKRSPRQYRLLLETGKLKKMIRMKL